MDDDAASDGELATRAGRGDGAAFEALVERHYSSIHALAWRLDPACADDLAQDVCVRLPSALRSFRGEAAFRTWLYRLVVNAARDAWRRAGAYGRAVEGWAEIDALRRADAAHDAVRADWLAGALATLSPGLRETVALVLGEAMTHAEAAAVLGVGEGTVSWRMSEVRRALRRRADEEETGVPTETVAEAMR